MTQEPENNQDERPRLIIVGAPHVGRTWATMQLIEKAKEAGRAVLVFDKGSFDKGRIEEILQKNMDEIMLQAHILRDELPIIKPYEGRRPQKEQNKPIDAILKKGRRRKY